MLTTNPRPPKIWTVCQVHSKRAHRVVAALEAEGMGTFLPTKQVIRYVDGKQSRTVRQVLPGYLLVLVGEDWSSVMTDGRGESRDGVFRVLSGPGRRPDERLASRVNEGEMARLMIGHASREWDDIEGAPVSRERSRKSRPSRRIRRRERWARGEAA